MKGPKKPGSPRGLPTLRGVPQSDEDGALRTIDRDDASVQGLPSFVDATELSPPPFVEVELSYERGQTGMPQERWRAVEVWTRNRIYVCDWNMVCIEVVDRRTGAADAAHALLGSVLAGGQRQHDDGMEMTYPLPRPDTEAVFEYQDPRKGYVSTSTVTRVVVRLRVLTVPRSNVRPTWEHLTSSHRVVPVKPK